MKSFVCIVLVVFLGTVAVQGYGPKIQRKKHGDSHKSSHRSHTKPSHGSHHGSPEKPNHHGSPQEPNHRPSHDRNFRPPNQHGHWDNSPIWDDRSDSRDNGDDSGSYDSYDRDDRDGRDDRDDSYGPADSYSDERDSSGRFGPSSSYEDYSDFYDHRHTKKPCHDKRPPKPTRKPIPTTPRPKPPTPRPKPPTPRPKPPTPRPIPPTPKPAPSTHRIPPLTLPPHPAHTRFTPNPTTTTESFRPNPTTPQIPTVTTVSRRTRSPWHPWTTPIDIDDTTHWETTTNSVPETTPPEVETTTVEGFTTISPETQACIDSCLSTPEYNPVCGSNGQTFDNEGKLFCASSCGIRVTLRRRSVCPPPIYDDYDDGDGSTGTPPPTTTTESNIGRNTPFSKFTLCMRQCPITPAFTPVCGSDLITYMNMDRLKCAQRCGEVVQVLCEKPCAACGYGPVTPRTTTTLRTTKTPYIGRSTQEPDIQECIDACPVTLERNPVCGSNHVTYRNPSHLICSQLCGDGVAPVHFGPCGPTTTTSTTTEALPPTLSPDVLRCIRRCPVTSEYAPVCGTDDLTYSNLGNLHCARYCGVLVELKHESRCTDEFDLGPDGIDSTTSRTTHNVNGTKDQVTTPSRNTVTASSLFTSRTTTTTAKPTITPTMTPASTRTPASTNAGSDSSSTLGFTIPNDVLVDIFGSTTTQAPTTKPTNPDEDEDVDLDARYNNETDNDTDKDTGRGH